MKRTIVIYTNIFFAFTTTVLLFFSVLSGVTEEGVNRYLYWSDTNLGSNTLRWTNYGICQVNRLQYNSGCSSPQIGYPYSPAYSITPLTVLPNDFINNEGYYFYMSRAGYFLLLSALVFTVLTLVFSFLPAFPKLGNWYYYLLLQSVWYGTLTALVGTILLTVVHVRGIGKFNDDGHESLLGVSLFGITWGSVASFIVTGVLSIVLYLTKSNDLEHFEKVNHLLQYNHLYEDVNPNDPLYHTHTDHDSSTPNGKQDNPFSEHVDTRGVYY